MIIMYVIMTPMCMITQITPHDSPGTLVFSCQRSRRNSNGIAHYLGAKRRWGRL